MANPLRGEATFKAGEVERTIVLDVNAFVEIEEDTGLGVNDLIMEMQGSPSFKLLRSIFCAGLQEKHPGTTAKEAGNIMSAAGIEEMTRALRTAIQAAMPEATEEDANPPKQKAKGK